MNPDIEILAGILNDIRAGILQIDDRQAEQIRQFALGIVTSQVEPPCHKIPRPAPYGTH